MMSQFEKKKNRICGYAQNTICNHSKKFWLYYDNYYMLQTILVYLWEKLGMGRAKKANS